MEYKIYKKEEVNEMKQLKALEEELDAHFKDEELAKDYPLMNFFSNKVEHKVVIGHLVGYLKEYFHNDNLPVDNISEKMINKYFKLKKHEHVVSYNSDKDNLEYFEAMEKYFKLAYSDWTNQVIGYELKLNDNDKILFLPKKGKILTNVKDAFILENHPILRDMLKHKIISYK